MGPYHLKCRPMEEENVYAGLKFAVFLYKQNEERLNGKLPTSDLITFGLDFQHLEGKRVAFLDFMGSLVYHLEV